MGLKADVRDYLDAAVSDLLDRREIRVSAGMFSLQQGHMSQGHVPKKPPSTSTDSECPTGTYVPTPLDMSQSQKRHQRQRTRGKYRTA